VISEKTVEDPSTALAYFYCDGNYPETQEARYVFGRLIRDLLTHRSVRECIERLRGLRESHSMDSETLLLRGLLSMLQWISNSVDRMYIIIDGLDECKERKELLALLRQLSAPNLHVLVTSRPETDIRKAFEGKPCLEMLEDAVQHDIATHIEWMLTHDEDLEDLPHSLKREIRERLVAKSQAMYGSLLDQN
jgi:hypothetical protein